MPADIKLTVLDQSPVHPVDTSPTQANAGQMSIDLARACDAMGYHRYWVAEHHNSPQFAGPSPEILITAIASVTQHMRVGSGGVMLSHYSPYKVAEVFNMLSALFPGRIDLGIGRAPGGDALASSALVWPHSSQNASQYPTQAATLKALLDHAIPADHPWAQLHISPRHHELTQFWMLGSSGGSAELAGQIGASLALARFISPDHCTPDIFDAYERGWQTAGHAGTPHRLLAIAAFCADTHEEAELLAGTAVYRKMMTQVGEKDDLLSPEVVQDRYRRFSESQQAQYQHVLSGYTVGTTDQCQSEIHDLAKAFATDEIAVVTVTHSYHDRLRSYELLCQ